MKFVPNWVIDALKTKKFKCHHCNKVLVRKNIKALGIRDSIGVTKEVFFIELECSNCDKITFFEMQSMNILQLSKEILAEINDEIDEMKEELGDKIHDFNDMSDETDEADEVIDEVDLMRDYVPKELSKISLKEIRDMTKILKNRNLQHDAFLEMMGMTPEELDNYGQE